VTPWKILGAQYGAYIIPAFANTNLSATLSNETLGGDHNIGKTNYAWADMYIQPIWLGWSLPHWDLEFGEGFYAPTGKYNTTTATLGPFTRTIPSSSNVGLGYWTNQMQGGAAWFPFDNKGTSVSGVLTWEANSKMSGISLTPGQILSLNWGALQYLPLTKDQTRLVGIGITGYDQWQVTDDTGSAANGGRGQIHAVGGQLGYVIVPSTFQINFRYLHEFNAVNRFEGDWYGLDFAMKMF
jgi:hypothetical protein